MSRETALKLHASLSTLIDAIRRKHGGPKRDLNTITHEDMEYLSFEAQNLCIDCRGLFFNRNPTDRLDEISTKATHSLVDAYLDFDRAYSRDWGQANPTTLCELERLTGSLGTNLGVANKDKKPLSPCAAWIIDTITKADHRLTRSDLIYRAQNPEFIYSDSSIVNTAAKLKKEKMLIGKNEKTKDDRGKGYGLPEWG